MRLWLSARSGSSPLTRGKRGGGRLARWGGRLIPAHAGKTSRRRACWHPVPAHPRSRGENPSSLRTDSFRPGSSPLTRGKRRVDGQAASLRRLIPAHAGKTRSAPEREPRGRAHPRSRGENVPSRSSGRPSSGSSPLTQGKRSKARSLRVCVRLIPAHAGKTPLFPLSSGSSPLTRGKHVEAEPGVVKLRLIPAHAGKT